MSQPRDSDSQNDALLPPLKDLAELRQIFTRFEKKPADFKIGVEHERFIVDPKTLMPVSFHGNKGIRALLNKLLKHYQDRGEGVFEGEELIAIMLAKASVTLEPGGQTELSGAPLASLFSIEAELDAYERALGAALSELGLRSLFMGFHPLAKTADFEWVPKQRYKIMRDHMQKTGKRGHDMMLRTCTVQANFDYASEDDMIASFRLALLASPVVTALFATSPFKEGSPGEFLSERTMVWHDTDPARCGFPLEVFDDRFGYARWIERAIDTPMYFVRRFGVYHDATAITFRHFMQNGHAGFKASLRDFEDHLTTIFTDARIKPQLEVRGADCGPRPMLLALPAFWKGLLYHDATKQKALALLSKLNVAELSLFQTNAATQGLRAKLGSYNLDTITGDLLELSRDGLKAIGHKNREGQDESLFLAPLFHVAHHGKNIAQDLLERYAKSGGSFAFL